MTARRALVVAVPVALVVLVTLAVLLARRSDDGAPTAGGVAASTLPGGAPDAGGDAGVSGPGGSGPGAPADPDHANPGHANPGHAGPVPGAAPAAPGGRAGGGRSQSEVEPESIVTYPPPPTDDCASPGGDAVVRFTGSATTPRCLRLGGDQRLAVRNDTDDELAVTFDTVQEVVGPRQQFDFGPVGTVTEGPGPKDLWFPGHLDATTRVVVG